MRDRTDGIQWHAGHREAAPWAGRLLPWLSVPIGAYLDMGRVWGEPGSLERFRIDPLALNAYPLRFIASPVTADLSGRGARRGRPGTRQRDGGSVNMASRLVAVDSRNEATGRRLTQCTGSVETPFVEWLPCCFSVGFGRCFGPW